MLNVRTVLDLIQKLGDEICHRNLTPIYLIEPVVTLGSLFLISLTLQFLRICGGC